LIIDTDVLIWFFRGNERARQLVLEQHGFSISAVTYMELVRGMRSKNEMAAMRRAFFGLNVSIIHISEAISMKASGFVEQLYHSHSLELADALIAATGIECGLPICTANSKHYKMMKELDIVKFRP